MCVCVCVYRTMLLFVGLRERERTDICTLRLHGCRDANGDELRMVASTRRDGNVAEVFVRVGNFSGIEIDPIKTTEFGSHLEEYERATMAIRYK